MPNFLTGDFQAVFQVSAGTLNRLLAGMHQLAGADPDVPHIPHAAVLRIGDKHMLDGVRGSVQAQIGVPRLELVHGSSDRFGLEVAVRATYLADPGTEPLADVIHGTIRAQYRLEDIDPNCRGWQTTAASHVRLRVVEGSVSFTGDVTNRGSLLVAAAALDEPAVKARITRQVDRLLRTRFEAVPQARSRFLDRGTMRSLRPPSGPSAVAGPVDLGGSPGGDLASIENVLLGNRDLAVAVDRAFIMAALEPTLQSIHEFKEPIDARGVTVYHPWVSKPTAEWTGHGTHASITLRVNGGARTESELPDLTFDVEQTLLLSFDAGAEALTLTAEPPNVTVTPEASVGSTLVSAGFGLVSVGIGLVSAIAKAEISKEIRGRVDKALETAQAALSSFLQPKQDVLEELRRFDKQADVYLDEALFGPHGVVVRGTIFLAWRKRPLAEFVKTADGEAFTAFSSWIPGGRIDRFQWSWRWAMTGGLGHAAHDDRFVLERPEHVGGGSGVRGTAPSGIALPGLDGWGRVCLVVEGVQVDESSGKLRPVTSRVVCENFGFSIAVPPIKQPKLLWPEWHSPRVPEGDPAPRPVGVWEIGAAHPSVAFNTLVVYAGEGWSGEHGAALDEGIGQFRRDDAGLVVVVLLREGALARGGADLRELHELDQRLAAPVLVNEDVGGAWAGALSIADSADLAWRLLSPRGGVTWMRNGHLAGGELSRVLETGLFPSPPPAPQPLRSGPAVGAAIGPGALTPYRPERFDDRCPPPPVGPVGGVKSIVGFVDGGSSTSRQQLGQLSRQYSDEDVLVSIVVDGAGEPEADRLVGELGPAFTAIPDPDGAIARRLGVRHWPTTLTLDPRGVVTESEVGVAAGNFDALGGEAAAE